MTPSERPMQVDEKYLVRQVVGDLLREEAPVHLPEFERDFEDLYGRVEDQLHELRHEDVHGDWKLPFDASFGAGLFVGTLIGVAAFLVREALAVADARQREERLGKLETQLGEQTGSPELVLILCARVLDLIKRIPANKTVPPDLEIQVHLTPVREGTALTYVLHSAAAGFHFEEFRGPDLKTSPEAFAVSLLKQIEALQDGYDVDGGRLLLEDAEKELESLGRSLYHDLFPGAMREAYRRFRGVRTVQITSDEPAIPWELIKPYDDEREPIIDDDFFCIRFQLTRWRNGKPPVPDFRVKKLACFGGAELPNAVKERDLLTGLATRHPGVEDASPPFARYRDVETLLTKGGCDLLHFVGHGDISRKRANEARIDLEDRPLRARNLTGGIQTALKKDRPLVFLNACRVARQGWSLTSLGGWVEALVRTCECGAFLGPQWGVKDSLAYEFAQVFYHALEKGSTLGEAAQAARTEVKRKAPGLPTWLAFAVYGHPNARISFGDEKTLPATGLSTQPTAERSLELRPAEAGTVSTEENMISRTHIMRDDQLDEARKLHEQEPNLKGRWIGQWENLVFTDKKGEEMIEVEQQENGVIEGRFFDTSTHDITIRFEGTLRFGHLLARYWAPKGERIMQDGYCFLKLQDDGSWRGYYADFFGCGLYVLKQNPRR